MVGLGQPCDQLLCIVAGWMPWWKGMSGGETDRCGCWCDCGLGQGAGPVTHGQETCGTERRRRGGVVRHSMACPKTQLAVAPSEKPSRTFLKFGTMNDPATGP